MYVVIVGCGRVGSELASLLSLEGHDVVIIDKQFEAFSRLGDAFNGIMITGSGVSTRVLQEAGIEKAGIFCSLTNSDNINIMASQVARGIFKVPRVIARIYDPRKAAIYKTIGGIDVLNETHLFASMIRDKITDRMLSSYLIETSELGVLEFAIPEEFVGKRVNDFVVPHECQIAAIHHLGGGVTIPEGQTIFVRDDVVLAVVRTRSLDKIKEKFQLK